MFNPKNSMVVRMRNEDHAIEDEGRNRLLAVDCSLKMTSTYPDVNVPSGSSIDLTSDARDLGNIACTAIELDDDDDEDIYTEGISTIGSRFVTQLREHLKGNQSVGPLCERYLDHITSFAGNFDKKFSTRAVLKLLLDNSILASEGNFQVISNGVDILVMYALNLLKPKKNPNWRSIKTSNNIFVAKVQPIQGHEAVLEHLGYSVFWLGSFEFPKSSILPDMDKVAAIASDLLILQKELHLFLDNTHPNMERFVNQFATPATGKIISTPAVRGQPRGRQTVRELHRISGPVPERGSPKKADTGTGPHCKSTAPKVALPSPSSGPKLISVRTPPPDKTGDSVIPMWSYRGFRSIEGTLPAHGDATADEPTRPSNLMRRRSEESSGSHRSQERSPQNNRAPKRPPKNPFKIRVLGKDEAVPEDPTNRPTTAQTTPVVHHAQRYVVEEEKRQPGTVAREEHLAQQTPKSEDCIKDCGICYSPFPMNEIVGNPYCQCHVCRGCFTKHFEVLAQSTPCMFKYVCPACQEPTLKDFDGDSFRDYFGILGIILQSYLNEGDFDLYQTKVASWGLMNQENFRWCVNGCGIGFINESGRKKLQCPKCSKYQCFECSKTWMSQHDGITCADFDSWKRSNDPEFQQIGLAAHLKENGINCPKCKMRYELAKGGCMHFTCPRCQHEFCCGCNLPFMKYPDCQVSASCGSKGLHAHHPRDCLYHLRDINSDKLQSLLQGRGINLTPPKHTLNPSATCPVILQQEKERGVQETECGKPLKGQSGLCELHYKEYLVSMINQHKLDPVDIFDINELECTLRRHDKTVPARGQESPAVYQRRLRLTVKLVLPLVEVIPD